MIQQNNDENTLDSPSSLSSSSPPNSLQQSQVYTPTKITSNPFIWPNEKTVNSTTATVTATVTTTTTTNANVTINGDVTSSSSSTNGSQYVTASSSSFHRIWLEKMLSLPKDRDKRLAKSYPSFIIGRFLAIASSFTLVLGLIIKFYFIENARSIGSIISYVIIGLSTLTFILASILVIYATIYKSTNVRKDFLKSFTSTKSNNTNEIA